MLAIIQDQQHLFGSCKVQQQLIERLIGCRAQTKRLCDILWDEFWFAQRDKIYQPDTIRKYATHITSNLDSKPRLTTSPSACQRNEARIRDEVPHFCQFPLATNKTRQLHR